MKQRIECHSQSEVDACIEAGNIAIVIGFQAVVSGRAEVEAWGNSSVEAWGNSSVVARENSSVEARENSSVEAWENSSVEAWENSSVEAWGNSSVEAWGNSSVEAWGNSSVEAWGNSSVVARENSSVVARGNSSVEAAGNAFIRVFAALKIKASAYVTIIKHGHAKTIEGGRQLDAAPEPTTGAEFCEFNGIDPATAPYVVPDLDAKILAHVEEKNHFDMSTWHGRNCDETNWCETTHCRAGFAICFAGKAGFELERKYGPEMAGRMIYAVSCPDDPLPSFTDSNEGALEDMRQRAGRKPVANELRRV